MIGGGGDLAELTDRNVFFTSSDGVVAAVLESQVVTAELIGLFAVGLRFLVSIDTLRPLPLCWESTAGCAALSPGADNVLWWIGLFGGFRVVAPSGAALSASSTLTSGFPRGPPGPCKYGFGVSD